MSDQSRALARFVTRTEKEIRARGADNGRSGILSNHQTCHRLDPAMSIRQFGFNIKGKI
jgi:hypothetical protein